MKKTALAALIAILPAIPLHASQTNNVYISGFFGRGSSGDLTLTDPYGAKDKYSLKSATPFGGAVGITQKNLRAEFEIWTMSNDVEKINSYPVNNQSWTFTPVMLNGYYDFNQSSKTIIPFAMIGLGSCMHYYDAPASAKQTKAAFAMQFGAGVGIKTSESLSIDLAYRYLSSSTADWDDGFKSKAPATSNFLAGIRYTFK